MLLSLLIFFLFLLLPSLFFLFEKERQIPHLQSSDLVALSWGLSLHFNCRMRGSSTIAWPGSQPALPHCYKMVAAPPSVTCGHNNIHKKNLSFPCVLNFAFLRRKKPLQRSSSANTPHRTLANILSQPVPQLVTYKGPGPSALTRNHQDLSLLPGERSHHAEFQGHGGGA